MEWKIQRELSREGAREDFLQLSPCFRAFRCRCLITCKLQKMAGCERERRRRGPVDREGKTWQSPGHLQILEHDTKTGTRCYFDIQVAQHWHSFKHARIQAPEKPPLNAHQSEYNLRPHHGSTTKAGLQMGPGVSGLWSCSWTGIEVGHHLGR